MGLFSRYQALKIQALQYDIFVHPLHDPGVFHDAVNFLRLYTRTYRYALVFLDHEGSGQEQLSSAEMSQMLRQKLEKNGWEQRVEVIVLAPELEIWLWINSSNMAAAVGWKNYAELKSELIQQKFWTDDALKPQQPKEAFEHILKKSTPSKIVIHFL
jgi:hypothetical protein